MQRLILCFLFCCFASFGFGQELPFSKGVNLTEWFQVGGPRQIQFTKFTKEDFEQIKSLGCDVVRLPINLHFMTDGAPAYTPDPLFLTFLDQVIDWAEELEIHLILDNHTFDVDENTDPLIGNILEKVWAQMAEHLKGRSEYLYYEVLNEPHGIDNALWAGIQQGVIDAIRAVDTTHYIVVGGADWNSYGTLESLTSYTDTKLIYTFHFYFPFLFTHQGATWVTPNMAPMAELPFPYEEDRMPPLPSSFLGTWLQSEYLSYPINGTVDRIKEELDIAIRFSEERGVPLFCGELGVFIPNSPSEDRNRWYDAVRSYLEEKGVAWTMWDYTGGFGVFEEGGADLFESDLNTPLLESLGFAVPEQSEFVRLPDTVGFPIYRDFIEEHINESSWNEGVLDYYSEESPNNGTYCIAWTQANQYNNIGFDLKPDRDLSLLVAEDYALDFLVRGDLPGLRLDIRFMDSDTDDPDDHPWRMGITLGEPEITWDGQWEKLHVPLSNFTERGAWEGEFFDPQGSFDWQEVDRLEIVAEYGPLGAGEVWFDQIQVTNLDTTLVNDSTVVGNPTTSIANEFQRLVQVYPNPTSGLLHLYSSDNRFFEVSLTDQLGRIIQKDRFLGEKELDMHSLSPGVYYLLMSSSTSRQQITKIVKR